MSTRRKIGVSIATTESARRQLMAPVQCWERAWVQPDANANFKVYKWVKTDRPQNFDDDEVGVDEPLAPLPDEPEVIEDEEEAQDETAAATPALSATALEPVSRATSEPELKPEADSKAASPKPHPLSMSFGPEDTTMEEPPAGVASVLGDGAGSLVDAGDALGSADVLGAGVLGGDGTLDGEGALGGTLSMPDVQDMSMSLSAPGPDALDTSEVPELNLTGLGPDGEPFEGAHDLSQIQPEDALLGGAVMDETITEDPFAMNTS